MLRLSSLLLSVLLLAACDRPGKPAAGDSGKDGSAARAIGRGAYKAAEEAGSVAKKAGKEIGKGLKEASEGWKEARRESKANKRKKK